MSTTSLTVLIVGGTGSIGRLAVDEALQRGHTVRVLTRTAPARFPADVEIVSGDLTAPDSLTGAVQGVDAVVFTHGTHGGGRSYQDVDYGGVRNVLTALAGRPVRIALMTAIGVTGRDDLHDWKRRGERLVRASGNLYTIVRPGWFDYNDPDQLALDLLQGDTRHAGSPADGVISRRQIAQLLIASLTSAPATGKTFELVAEQGPAQDDLDTLFAALEPDQAGQIDGVRDVDNMPQDTEPAAVRQDLDTVRAARPS